MTRATLTKTMVVGPYPAGVVADSLDIVMTAANPSNKEQFAPGGDDVIIAWNTDGASPYTFTVTSAPDPFGRTSDINGYSLAAGEHAAFRVKNLGWVQSDGKVYLEANNAAIKFGILAL